MAEPATPLDNKEAIAQLNQAMNFIVTDIIRPTAIQLQQTAEIAQSNARSIAAEGEKVRELRESVEILRNVADDVAGESDNYAPRIPANEKRFETLLAEAREDRQKSDERFEVMGQRLDAQLSEIRALGEQNRALLSALAATNNRVDTLEQTG